MKYILILRIILFQTYAQKNIIVKDMCKNILLDCKIRGYQDNIFGWIQNLFKERMEDKITLILKLYYTKNAPIFYYNGVRNGIFNKKKKKI